MCVADNFPAKWLTFKLGPAPSASRSQPSRPVPSRPGMSWVCSAAGSGSPSGSPTPPPYLAVDLGDAPGVGGGRGPAGALGFIAVQVLPEVLEAGGTL